MTIKKSPFYLLILILCLQSYSSIIQSGMILNILVKGDELLSRQVKVQSDGTIDYPLYQDAPVSGMTTSELQEILTIKLVNYSDAPFVLVTVLNEMPQSITVLGQVTKPGVLKVDAGTNLQEILLLAGGTTNYANLEKIKIVQKDQLDEDASFYNFQEFLTSGNLALLPKIQEGDKIIVLAKSQRTQIKVLGAVKSPGYFSPPDTTNLFDVLYLAGGPVEDANLSKVRIISSEDGGKADNLIDLKDYIDTGKMKDIPKVYPGDVVVVYRKTFTWSKSLSIVRDVATLVTAFIIISNFNQIFN